MTHSNHNSLLAALNAEYAALLSFSALLEREQSMLVKNNTDQMFELSEQKLSDAVNLNKLAETSRHLLRKHIPQQGTEAIRDWIKNHAPECLPVWQDTLTLTEQARHTNNTNGELIQMKLRHNQQALSVLSNAVNKANLYGPDGQTSFSPGSGRSLGSG